MDAESEIFVPNGELQTGATVQSKAKTEILRLDAVSKAQPDSSGLQGQGIIRLHPHDPACRPRLRIPEHPCTTEAWRYPSWT